MKVKTKTPQKSPPKAKTPQKAKTPNKTPQKAKTPNKTPQSAPGPKNSPKNVEISNKQVTSEYKAVKVTIPNLPTVANVLQDLIELSETIKISYNGISVILGLSPGKADNIVKKLSSLEYNGKKLKVNALYNRSIEPLIKRISLTGPKFEEKLKLHYNATKVVCQQSTNHRNSWFMYLLHFSTKEEADASMSKFIQIENKKLYPLDYIVLGVAEKRSAPQNGSPAKKLKTDNKAKSRVPEEEEEDDDDDDDDEEEEDDEEEDEDDEDEEEDDDDE